MSVSSSVAQSSLEKTTEVAQRFIDLVYGHFERFPVEPLVEVATNTEYWDFASTGSICNISPFIGYLWLMTRYRFSTDNGNASAVQVFVPKIASAGGGGGTVDTLSAGGYQFLSEPSLVREMVRTHGGRFFQQDDDLTGYDKPLMKIRKEMGLMASGELVLASILAKKLAIGTTHVVIDIKVGADGKMYPRLAGIPMPEGLLPHEIARETRGDTIATNEVPQVFVPATSVPHLASWLAALLGGVYDGKSDFVNLDWYGHARQKMSIRLIFSSADTPQCRAVGRLLVLHQIESLASGHADGRLPDAARDWYWSIIPRATGALSTACATESDTTRFNDEWEHLKTQLPRLKSENSDYAQIKGYIAQCNSSPADCNTRRSLSPELSAVTVFGRDVPKWVDAKLLNRHIWRMPAYPLDTLFSDALTRISEHDPAVGFWLHRLPGEQVTESCPVISAFFRPGDEGATLKRQLIRYLSECVEFQPQT